MKNSLDRLTSRAKKIIQTFTDFGSEVPSSKMFSAIVKSGGMGKELVSSLSLKLKSGKKALFMEDLVRGAYYEALRLHQPYVGTEHLLLALLALVEPDCYDGARQRLEKISAFPKVISSKDNRESLGLLDLVATNLNLKVVSETNKSYIYRDSLEVLISTLLQKESPNPLIVGDSGVGKRSLVSLLASRMNTMDVPPSLLGYRIYEVDLLSLITSNLNKGNLDSTLASFFTEIMKLNRVIVCLKNFEGLFFTSGNSMTVPLIYNSFKAQLEDAGIRYIATCTSDVYSRLSVDNSPSLNNFSAITLMEPEEKITREILDSNARYLGAHHGVEFSSEILDYVYLCAEKEIPEERFPQKAVDLMDQAAAKVLLRKAKVPEKYKDLLEQSILLTEGLDRSLEVREYDQALSIRDMISGVEEEMLVSEKKMFRTKTYNVSKKDVDSALEDYGVDKNKDSEQDISSLTNLEDRVGRSVIGQGEAVSLVCKALLRARLGLRSKKRPFGNFLFLGPTGVGKTELAKVLSNEFYGESSLIRLDMSDFGEKHTVARLVGAPPGYVGYGEGGELTSKIERNPSSLVLFDEIEKAHPDVLNILLQIMEEGELVDAKGTTFDFSKSVVVLTSNLGTEIVHKPGIGFEAQFLNDSSLEKRLTANLKKILKPELLNRLDEVVIFKRLGKPEQHKILDLMLTEVKGNLASQRIKIRISSKVRDLLLEAGYSDEYGARALRRTVEREFLDKVAEVLLSNKKRPLSLSATVSGKKICIKVTKIV